MTLADPLKRRRSLYQDTEKQEAEQEQEPQEEVAKQEVSPAPIVERPISIVPDPPVEPVQETRQLPIYPYPDPTYGLGQPSFHDRRSKVPYNKRYRKENLMLDVRLVPYIYHWLDTHGINKTDAVNRAWLKVLLADGYQIDPSILDRPCKPEDLPEGL